MHWQLIVLVGFIVSGALFLAALFLYSNLRGSHSTGQKGLGLRTDRAVTRSITGTDCRG
jgi:membrane-associated phospholipid phosphatase